MNVDVRPEDLIAWITRIGAKLAVFLTIMIRWQSAGTMRAVEN
jgi:hypothetical protein